jgi:hypothetical protein
VLTGGTFRPPPPTSGRSTRKEMLIAGASLLAALIAAAVTLGLLHGHRLPLPGDHTSTSNRSAGLVGRVCGVVERSEGPAGGAVQDPYYLTHCPPGPSLSATETFPIAAPDGESYVPEGSGDGCTVALPAGTYYVSGAPGCPERDAAFRVQGLDDPRSRGLGQMQRQLAGVHAVPGPTAAPRLVARAASCSTEEGFPPVASHGREASCLPARSTRPARP